MSNFGSVHSSKQPWFAEKSGSVHPLPGSQSQVNASRADMFSAPRSKGSIPRELQGGSSDEDDPKPMEEEQIEIQDDKLEVEEDPNSCWQQFKRGVRALWRTRDMEDTSVDRQLYVSTTLRELAIYLVFLAVMCIVAFGMSTSNAFLFSNGLMGAIINANPENKTSTFATMFCMADLWDVLMGPIMDGIYAESWYNNQNVDDKDANYVAYESKLLGVPRIRQVKVRNNSCDIPTTFNESIKDCYSMYAEDVEDRKPFGLMNSTAWNYTDKSVLGTSNTWTPLATYGGGGFYVDLTRQHDPSLAIIQNLIDNLWIQRGTRAILMDFTVYNANINLFCIIKLVFQLPATGGVVPFYEFRVVKLLRYVTTFDYVIMIVEIAYILFIIYYIVEEILEIKRNSYYYFLSFWNVLDIGVIFISIICCVFNVYRTVAVGNKLDLLLADQEKFIDFDFLSFWSIQFNNAVAMAQFFAMIKIFKYISFNKTMTQLSETLGKCAKDLAGFAIMFFIIFLAFAQLGYLMFGAQVDGFCTFADTIFTLFRIILGDFDFNSLEAANRVLGPTYFLLYVFFVFFVLLNMFIAIINETYSEVKQELAERENEFEVADFFKEKANRVLERLHLKRERIMDIQLALQEANLSSDSVMDVDDLRRVLKMKGYAEGEIEAVLAKYDTDGDQKLDYKERAQLNADLEKEKARLNRRIGSNKEGGDSGNEEGAEEEDDDEVAAELKTARGQRHEVSPEEYRIVANRVNRMETTLDLIVSKIDSMLLRMESIDVAKLAQSSAALGSRLSARSEIISELPPPPRRGWATRPGTAVRDDGTATPGQGQGGRGEQGEEQDSYNF